jgi:hypothetical protein
VLISKPQEMAPPKRKTAETTVTPAKRVKKSEWSDVIKELKHCSLNEDVHGMLEKVMPLSLGVFADHRHKFQEQMVLAVEDILKEVEGRKSNEVAKLKGQMDEVNKKKPETEEAAEEAVRRKDAKTTELREKQDALAAAALSFRAARSRTTAAHEAKRNGEDGFLEAQSKRAEYAAMLEDLAFLQAAPLDDAETTARRSSLISMMRKCNFEDAMMVVLPEVFKKPPSDRGEFDAIALDGVSASLRKRIAQQDELINAEAPQQEERKAAIVDAEASFKTATVGQVEAAKSYEATRLQAESEQEACTAAQKVVRDEKNNILRLSRLFTAAEAELELFLDGPRANFQRLKCRMEPVVEEPAVQQVSVSSPDKQKEDPAPEQPTAPNAEDRAEVVEETAA